jgi:hypothetical protein
MTNKLQVSNPKFQTPEQFSYCDLIIEIYLELDFLELGISPKLVFCSPGFSSKFAKQLLIQ